MVQPGCTVNATVQNISHLSNDCGVITLEATTSTPPISFEWKVVGTDPTNFNISGNTLTGVPGIYTIFYVAVYPCEEGGTAKITDMQKVIIPYKPDFSYITECNDDNTFNINFIDNSNFYAGLTTHNVYFSYKAPGASTFTPVAYNPALNVYEMENLTAGPYVFKVRNEGGIPGTTFPACEKEYTVNLQGISALTTIVVAPIGCHNTAVQFGLTINPPTGSTVLWDFGDGAQNSSISPKRVYTNPNIPYNVTCTITNAFGCELELPGVGTAATVNLPAECFFGDIIATPADATVCKGKPVLLTYESNNDNCLVDVYTWMNGSSPVLGAANAPTLTVYTPGFYWVKVSSSNNCDYNAPTQITPTFKALPSVKIKGQARYCEDAPIVLTAVTNATTIEWAIGGTVQHQFDNLATADFTGMFSATTFDISCTVSDGFCENTAHHTITVEEAIVDILVDVTISCIPEYSVTITAEAITYSGAIAHYNWSNGEVGDAITVTNGGAFSVTASTGGGCSFTKQIDVPKNPENYMWIFPSGCYTDCSKADNYLIGPLVPLGSWSWNNNGQSAVAGTEFTNSFPLDGNGTYSLTINTGTCDLESEPLNFTAEKCGDCEIEDVIIEEIKKVEAKYCAFTQTLVILSGASQPFQATISDPANNVAVVPGAFTIFPGPNVIQVTLIAQSPFIGGGTTLRIHGQLIHGDELINCEYIFPITIPFCEGVQVAKTGNSIDTTSERASLASCTLYPNPAKGSVQLQYDLGVANSTVEVYELTGRLITQQTLSTSQGTTTINTSNLATGMYIVLVRDENQILYQQKLVIK